MPTSNELISRSEALEKERRRMIEVYLKQKLRPAIERFVLLSDSMAASDKARFDGFVGMLRDCKTALEDQGNVARNREVINAHLLDVTRVYSDRFFAEIADRLVGTDRSQVSDALRETLSLLNKMPVTEFTAIATAPNPYE